MLNTSAPLRARNEPLTCAWPSFASVFSSCIGRPSSVRYAFTSFVGCRAMAVVKNSGRTIHCAPSRMASRTQCSAFSRLAATSPRAACICTAATRTRRVGPCARADPRRATVPTPAAVFSRSRRDTRPMASSGIHPTPDAGVVSAGSPDDDRFAQACRGCGPRGSRKSRRRRPRRQRPIRAAGRHGERARVRS